MTETTSAGLVDSAFNNNLIADLSEMTVVNTGTLQGSGYMPVPLFINELFVEVSSLSFMEFDGDVENHGNMILEDDTFLGIYGDFVNHGLLESDDGGAAMDGMTMAIPGSTFELNGFSNTSFGDLVNRGHLNVNDFSFVEISNFNHQLGADSSVFIDQDATILIDNWTGDGSFNGTGTMQVNGDASPGEPTAVVSIEGDLHLGADSLLRLEFSGPTPGQYDQMLIDGDMIIATDATLSLQFINGFQLQPNAQFFVANVGGNLSGSFFELNDGEIVGNLGGINIHISYNNGIVFTAVDPNALVGDVNQDGIADLLDVAPFVQRITSGEFQAEADANQDLQVNLIDVAPFVSILAGG